MFETIALIFGYIWLAIIALFFLIFVVWVWNNTIPDREEE